MRVSVRAEVNQITPRFWKLPARHNTKGQGVAPNGACLNCEIIFPRVKTRGYKGVATKWLWGDERGKLVLISALRHATRYGGKLFLGAVKSLPTRCMATSTCRSDAPHQKQAKASNNCQTHNSRILCPQPATKKNFSLTCSRTFVKGASETSSFTSENTPWNPNTSSNHSKNTTNNTSSAHKNPNGSGKASQMNSNG